MKNGTKDKVIPEIKGEAGDLPKLDMPKYGLDGNPTERMSSLFSDTAEAVEEAGKESEQGELGDEQPPVEKQAPSEKDGGLAKPGEEKKEPPVEEVSEKVKYEKLQGFYDRTKQELELAREIAADATDKALKQEKEIEELQKFKSDIAPLIGRIKIQGSIEDAIKEVVVPQDKWTGTDAEGNPVASDTDKLAFIVVQKPDIMAALIEKAADVATEKRFMAMAKAQVRQSEVNTRFIERNKVELNPKLIARINAKLSKDAPAIIMNPNISNELKDDIIDRAYEKVLAEDKGSGGEKVVEKDAEELQKELEKHELNEKRAKMAKSKSGLTQEGRTKIAEGGEDGSRDMKELEDWYEKKHKDPLL